VSILLAGCSSGPPSTTTFSTSPVGNQPVPTVASGAQAKDHQAEALLREALVAAKTYFVRRRTYAGFRAAMGASIDQALHWVEAGRADLNRIHVKFVSAKEVVFTTLSATGTVFCVADDADVGAHFGRGDAISFDGCTGGW
jgi:hypothetical protein